MNDDVTVVSGCLSQYALYIKLDGTSVANGHISSSVKGEGEAISLSLAQCHL